MDYDTDKCPENTFQNVGPLNQWSGGPVRPAAWTLLNPVLVTAC